MRVQVRLSVETKVAAEAQAASLGYASLAAMLRVVATGLARDHNPNSSPEAAVQKAVEAILPDDTNPPAPEQFNHWPPHVGPSIARSDPQLYRFMVKAGLIH